MNDTPWPETPDEPPPPPPRPSLTERIGTQRPPHSDSDQPGWQRPGWPKSPTTKGRHDATLGFLTAIALLLGPTMIAVSRLPAGSSHDMVPPIIQYSRNPIVAFLGGLLVVFLLGIAAGVLGRPRFTTGLVTGFMTLTALAILLIGACFVIVAS